MIKDKEYEIKEGEVKGKYLSTAEVSEILGITKKGVRYLVEVGKLISYSKILGKKKLVYLYSCEEVEEYKRRREGEVKSTSLGLSNEEKLPSLHHEEKIVKPAYLKENEELKQENKKLLVEVGRMQGLYQGKDDQVRQIQNLLAERTESFIEREAKIKELEAKLDKEKEDKLFALKELAVKNIPWWKKIFTSSEEINKEINKRLLEG